MVPRAPSPPPPADLDPRQQRVTSTSPSPQPKPKYSRVLSYYSLSNEADDERTPSGNTSSMEDNGTVRGRRNGSRDRDGDDVGRQYEGEDVRETSGKELRGFYMYGWAAEVFVVCGMGSFIPITLEQLARERGYLERDPSKSCKSGLEMPDHFKNHTGNTWTDSIANLLISTAASPRHPRPPNHQCIVKILGMEINTASFAMYTFSFSVLVQAMLIISMSGAADHGRWRKTLLLTFGFTGALATMLFLPITPAWLGLGALLAIIANTCFGASFVLLNSFLPLLVRHHPDVQFQSPTPSDTSSTPPSHPLHLSSETTALLSRTDPTLKHSYPPPPTSTTTELRLSTQISSLGIGIGYIAALIVQFTAIFSVRALSSSLFSLRLALFIIGAWWFIFTIPTAFWLRPRPGPPLHTVDGDVGYFWSWWMYFSFSWRSLFRTIKKARKLRDTFLFLCAWFLLSDAIATVSGTAILFAKTSLNMQPASLALITVTATLSGIVGAFSWSRLSGMMGLKPEQTILACICLFELIPIYGLLGYIPAVQRFGMFGLQQPWEMYPLGAIYGFVMGGLSSFCRSLYGELIPPGFEAAFYALYAITDKGSSIFGPAIVGVITDATGEIRPAFWFLAVLIGLPFPLMLFVDVERGRRDGIAMGKELEEVENLEAAEWARRRGVDGGPIRLEDEEVER
ncbi:MFS general substrate transporter [Tothia fuscella]|uniref:Autophagy-related protein n=1 Tax=Tothia fuscella TaxID=1048955 RepID=A0A9P4TXI8_9PEZI|nr:MFS general substrate transporter [Tothia fuscella]